jgi:hypothetical protein
MVYSSSYAGSSLFDTLVNSGFVDVILPFVLIFTIIFAITEKIKLFGEEKKYHVIIALVISLATIFPHIMGYYPDQLDPVKIMYSAIPTVSIWIIAVVMVLILIGVFGKEVDIGGSSLGGWAVIASILIVGYIFLSSSGIISNLPVIPYLEDPATMALVVILLVFGIVIAYVTGSPKDKPGEKFVEEFRKVLKP